MRKITKNSVSYAVPYHKEEIKFDIPKNCTLSVIKTDHTEPIKDLNLAIKNALSDPINSPPLEEIIQGKNSACIVVTDITRNSPDKEILPVLLDILEKQIDKKNISILIGSGMHRTMTKEEKIERYGKSIIENYKILDHDAQDESNLIDLGITKNCTPIKISKIVYESDLLISIGIVTLHQYAGYSGGYKTVAIGTSSDKTISSMHSLKMLKNQKASIGKIEDNPFQQDIIEIGNKVNLNFIINVIMNYDKVIDVSAGEPKETFKSIVKRAKSTFESKINGQFDVVICGVRHPSDSNLYLASRAASFIALGENPTVKKDGYIIIPAKCSEGGGKGIGERRFMAMLGNNSLDDIIQQENEFVAGEQRAFVIAKVLKYCKIIIVGIDFPNIVKNIGMLHATDMDEAFQIITNDIKDDLEIALIPNSMSTLPIVNTK